MAFFKNTEELLAKFSGFKAAGYYEPVSLTDTAVGFSIKKDYPEGIRFKPAIGQKNSKPDHVAVIWISYLTPSDITEVKVSLRIRVSTMSLYLANHFDYDFDNPDSESPTRESYEQSKATPKPVELEFGNQFYFHHGRDVFIDKDGYAVTGVELLDYVFKTHCDTVHLLKGLSIRLKLLAHEKVTGVITLFIYLFTWLLKHAFGRTPEDHYLKSGGFRKLPIEAMRKLETDSLDIFGY